MTQRAIVLRLALLDVTPRVWRRLRVPEAIALDQLHAVFQRAMGWSDSHEHEFVIHGTRYDSRPSPGREAGVRVLPERGRPLWGALGASRSFDYLYDFGDGWQHLVVVESIDLLAEGEEAGVQLIAGGGACPPEDVGGPAGYAGFLAAIASPAHPKHRAMLDWVGGAFDPAAFDAAAIARALADPGEAAGGGGRGQPA